MVSWIRISANLVLALAVWFEDLILILMLMFGLSRERFASKSNLHSHLTRREAQCDLWFVFTKSFPFISYVFKN